MPREKDTGPFKPGEKVLVPHTDKYYEAKATKAEKRADGIWYYLCHYPGWNKKWDEWVEAPGLVKYDPKLVDGGESKDEEGGGKKKSQPGKRPEKRRKLNDIGAPDAELPGEDAEPAIQVQLPASLKQLLLDGHQAFSKGQKLPRLPHSPTVGDILQRYLEERTGEKQLIDPREEVATGLRVYFDKALQHMLLYEQERDECEQALSDGVVPSSLYGGEHLLRLCAKLPYLVPLGSAAPDSYAALQEQLAAFVAFLDSHLEFFLPVAKYVKV